MTGTDKPRRIHETAVVHPDAKIGPGVEIGPYSIIGQNVEIGPDTVMGAHVNIDGITRLGARNRLFPFCSLGTDPQDLKYKGEPTAVEIGDDNTIREYVTINRGTDSGGGCTRVGNKNLLMTAVHIAHDCIVRNGVIMANAASLAGHVEVFDYANLGAFVGVHQFCRIGRNAFIGGYTVLVKDAVPFSRVAGNRARCYGANTVGLRRHGFTDDQLAELKRLFSILFRAHLNTAQAVEKIEKEFETSKQAQEILEFIRASERGIVKS